MAQATTTPRKAEAPLTPDIDDAEMVGFLDALFNREPVLVDQTSVAFTNDGPEADSPQLVDKGETPTNVPLHRLVNIVASTIEVPSIFIFLIIQGYLRSARREIPPSTGGPKKWLEHASHFLFFFLSVGPIVTGAYMWFKVRKIECDDGDYSLKCRVSPSFMLAIALFRIFGVGGLFWGGVSLLVLFGNNFVGGDSQETNAA
ncbi:hypothetical protein B0J13DRAFT_630151 [Dactylonectria estremocensis]|uniref:Uncharacterized protein n=1 Tax=Dactylonectria estremocensis TaxID=1079267 RepID=A0A9P9DE16_9HYPO|nr:hypothetical protein B0J13DRAFT_630151 [Dactylonectria estremocensis]